MAERNSGMLAHGEWLDALRDLSLCCAVSACDETQDRVREINALLLVAPARSLIDGLRPIGATRIEALINAGACETAIMTMLEAGAGFLLSRGSDGQSLATVALPGSAHEASGAGASPTLALVGAMADALASTASGERMAARQRGLGRGHALH
ncbi:hypothetical protein [Novosphingobium sp. 9U]|uniref:hypothetical protein n=1 Tax=Novosphingobium sp. 9U TaxID=2653158 RepID=UPI0012EFD67E|nr:hypothetical protein [Novosphingobium sp. 9U]VWX54890.1 conserved hypothetical protein [Novosphingobium sp. 9U]